MKLINSLEWKILDSCTVRVSNGMFALLLLLAINDCKIYVKIINFIHSIWKTERKNNNKCFKPNLNFS